MYTITVPFVLLSSFLFRFSFFFVKNHFSYFNSILFYFIKSSDIGSLNFVDYNKIVKVMLCTVLFFCYCLRYASLSWKSFWTNNKRANFVFLRSFLHGIRLEWKENAKLFFLQPLCISSFNISVYWVPLNLRKTEFLWTCYVQIKINSYFTR